MDVSFTSLKAFYAVLLVLTVNGIIAKAQSVFELPIVHINDFHARFEETNDSGGSCKEGDACIGGFSRLYRQIRTILDDVPDAVLLDAGDDFQGTLWYTIGKWNVTQEFMNKLPFEALVLGNHEFDDRIAGVVPFIKALNHPVVISNVNDTLEPSMQGIYNKSTVIERNGKKIGIIGVILSTVNEIASVGNLKFFPESESVNEEAERLVREEGVFTNIVLSHCGYDIDQEIAANASEKISVVVGGHSHSFLYTGDDAPGPDTVAGPYPTIVQSRTGKNVLVTQASAYCKYLGNITLFLDENGELVDYSGSPIFLDNSFPQDEEINEAMKPWKAKVDAQGTVVLGETLVTLSNSGCYYSECTLGNFVADAMIYSWMDQAEEGSWTYAAIAFTNAGGLRTTIEIGNVTYGDMVLAQPFENTFNVGELEGKHILDVLEYCALPYDYGRAYSSLKMMQFSGIQAVFDLNREYYDRVVSVKVRCQECLVPVYEDLDLNKTYRVVINSFLLDGGDGFSSISDNIKNMQIGPVDIDVLSEYMQVRSPVFVEEEGRITILGQENIVFKNLDT